jgi:hypothetical protein
MYTSSMNFYSEHIIVINIQVEKQDANSTQRLPSQPCVSFQSLQPISKGNYNLGF